MPLAPTQDDAEKKEFKQPSQDKSGLYIYRNTGVGQALKKSISIDGEVIGETANKTYFYREITPGTHEISTQSEFGDNSVTLEAVGGTNHFVEQYIKMGVFVGGANLKIVSNEEGKSEVKKCKLAK